LALLRQTLHEWLRDTRLPSLAYLCVCSDPTVKEGIDALTTQQSDLDFEVKTDAASVRSFLDAPFAGVKMVFSTYQSAHKVGEAMQPGEAFDLAVFDEAHKTAGPEGRNNAFALKDANLPIRKRLFLTATPRHYNPLGEDKEGTAQLVFSMDNPLVYGKQEFRLNFAEAARRDIICNYKVVISVITSNMVTDDLLSRGEVLVNGDPIRARQVANQIALTDAIAKNGVNKVFTFHSTVPSAASFVAAGSEGVRTHLPEFQAFHVNGEMPTAKRERVMRDFRAAPRAVISNARCLTEGVDVPAVDMVAFLSPKRSLVDIVQATGRAMRKSPETGKKLGYVLVPLYVEQARGESIEEAVMRSDFDEVWNVLNRLQEHDEVLAQIISEMRIERGKTGGFDDSRFRERVAILGPSVSLENLRHSITAACLDAIGEGWFERYGQLLAYQQKHENRDMPARWRENQKLATWVVNQRVLRRDGVLEDEKIALLDRIGFKWSPHESTWRTQYLALLNYRERFKDCHVPQNWKENKSLAHWVKTQRNDYGKGELSRERIAALEKIGFEWLVGLGTWDERFAELCAYKERFHDTLVPVKWPENPLLGAWVSSQRYKGNTGKLRKELEDRLNSIGFKWRAPNALQPTIPVAKRIEALLAHKTEHGHLSVSRHDKKYPGLASWMTDQRARLKNKTIPDELKRQLDEIGFPWKPAPPDTEKQWLEMFAQIKEYAAAHGSSTVRIVDDKTGKLNSWAQTQRQTKKRGKLSESRIEALDEIGFAWQRVKKQPVPKPALVPSVPETPLRTWDEMFSELTNFYRLQGHCNVPMDWQANPELPHWVYLQRVAKRQNSLTADQLRRMDEIGFAWNMHDGDWDAMFSKLVEHLRPMHNGKSRDVAMSGELRRWTLTQRQLKKRGELDAEREEELASIGFEWEPFSAQWGSMLARLHAYHAKRGNCLVPSKWPEDQQLASWVGTQRMRKSEDKLSAERIAKLDALNFEWRPKQGGGEIEREPWEKMFAQLQTFHQTTGHASVPQTYAANKKLAWWVTTQRRNCRKQKLTDWQIARLNELNFEWNGGRKGGRPRTNTPKPPRSEKPLSGEKYFETMFQALLEYKQAQGDCLVPQRWKENRKLAEWVSEQRMAYNRERLAPERVRRLDEVGFEWDPIGTRWEEMFQQLVEYKELHGDTNVPQRSGKYAELGTWVRNQRAAKRYNRPILAERGKRLDEIGFVWRLVERNAWERMLERLVEFKKIHGHCNVPQKAGENKRLGKWVNSQRTTYYRKKLLPERQRQLEEIGFVWNLRPNLAPVR
ncbi:MAG: hypothetical protein HOP33_19195, partial [Verrucomicrobia bacterium]|nr:hypothetical protein [Verrucomicrobiota bacterium]